MQSTNEAVSVPKPVLWIGRVMSALPVFMLLMSATMKFMKPAPVLDLFSHLGLPEKIASPLGILEITCTIIYLIPRTAVLGAILLTGYLGGAIATHVRVGDQFLLVVIFGVLVWGGLFLRDPRLRALIPLRR